jgi:hypothetical protein
LKIKSLTTDNSDVVDGDAAERIQKKYIFEEF